MATLGTAYVQILPSTEGISGALQQGIGAPSQAAGKTAGTMIGSAIKKYITAAAIGGAIKKSITEGAQLEQNIGGTTAVFGKSANKIQATAKTAYKNMGLSASDYMATANKMGSLFQGSGMNANKSLKLTQQSMQRAADVASVMGVDMDMAMESIAGAAKGNFTMMDNLGVAMNATTLQAYALEKGINFDWNTATNAEKSELAMKMFMDRTAQYEGNFAHETESTLQGSMDAMKASFSNFMGALSLGQDVGPALSGLVSSASTFLFNNLIPALLNIVKAIPNVIFGGGGGLVGEIISKLPGLITQILSSATSLLSDLADGATNMLTGHLTDPDKATKMMASGVAFAKQLGLGLIRGIPQLLIAATKLIAVIPASIVKLLGSLFSQTGSVVSSKISKIVGTIRTKFAAAKEAILSPIRNAKDKLKEIIEKIKGIFKNAKPKLSLKIPSVSVSGGEAPWGIAGKGKLPSFKVKWNKKAVDNPYMFSNATLFGAGETKDEVLYGRQNLMRDIREASGGNIDYSMLAEVLVTALKGLVIVTEVDGREIARSSAPHMQKELNSLERKNGRRMGVVGV